MRSRLMMVLGSTLTALCLGGCVVTSATSSEESGVQVSEATLDQVQVGQTTEGWLIAALGQPTARTAVPGAVNTEILRYEHETKNSTGSTILFLYAGKNKKTKITSAYFEVTDGVVTRYWTEK